MTLLMLIMIIVPFLYGKYSTVQYIFLSIGVETNQRLTIGLSTFGFVRLGHSIRVLLYIRPS
jgi:hypothetical protein